MSIQIRLWKIDGDDLTVVESEPLDAEDRLPRWLERDISMVSDDLLVIGSHVTSELGGELDLLAIDREGDLAVIELKRDRTPRDVVAQALHCAAWIWQLSSDAIEELGEDFLEKATLEEAFRTKFGTTLPDVLNASHRVYIVAAEMDNVSESIVRYLSEEYSANVNVIFFKYFRDAEGSEWLGRSWLMEPSEVEERGAPPRDKMKGRSPFLLTAANPSPRPPGPANRSMTGISSLLVSAT
jgi:hypothetical protein